MLIIFLLMVALITGFISVLIFEHLCQNHIKTGYRYIIAGLVFDLLTLVIMLFGLRFCKGILWFSDLWVDFNCMSFSTKFAILSIVIAVILGVIAGLICKCMKRKHWWIREKE
jgi:uncharacterized membrane protein